MPWPMVFVTAAIYSVARFGKAAGLTGDVAELTGRAPVSLQSWASDTVEAWHRPQP